MQNSNMSKILFRTQGTQSFPFSFNIVLNENKKGNKGHTLVNIPAGLGMSYLSILFANKSNRLPAK